MSLRCSVTIAATIAMLAVAQNARAADVGVVGKDADDRFVSRLVQELEQLGFSVARADSLEASRDTAVLVTSDDASIDLHDPQPDGSGSRRKRRLVARRGDPLQVAEEVRALLLPVLNARPPPAPTVATSKVAEPERATPPVSKDPPPNLPAFEASAGASALIGAATAGLGVTAAFAFFPRVLRTGRASFGAGIGALGAVVPENVSTAAGSTDIHAVLFGPEIIARLEPLARFSTDLALGVWATHVRFEGSAVAPFTSRDDSAWTFSPTARLRVQTMFGTIGAFAESRAGLSVPEIAVRFGGASVLAWGQPWGSLGGGLALAF